MRVLLFVPCFIDQLYPNVGVSSLKVLESLGCDVIFPENQTCCGQPAYNSGYSDEARLIAAHEVNVFLKFQSSTVIREFDFENDYVVGPSGSCVAMVRNFYPALLSHDPLLKEIIHRISSRTLEFTEFIARVIGVEHFHGRLDESVSYHDSCHALRELCLREEPRNILRQIDGLRLIELPYNEVCCGFGGTFAVKYPEISSSMADEKLKNFLGTKAKILVSGDMSCLMHLEGRARRIGVDKRFAHISEIMAESIA